MSSQPHIERRSHRQGKLYDTCVSADVLTGTEAACMPSAVLLRPRAAATPAFAKPCCKALSASSVASLSGRGITL